MDGSPAEDGEVRCGKRATCSQQTRAAGKTFSDLCTHCYSGEIRI